MGSGIRFAGETSTFQMHGQTCYKSSIMCGTPQPLYCLCIETQPAYADAVESALEQAGLDFAAWLDEAGPSRFEQYFPNREEAEGALLPVHSMFENWMDAPPHNLRISVLPAVDWAESWKQTFVAERVSARIVVKPCWESWEPAADDVIVEVNPGMAFGTGRHATTRCCLQFLDSFAPVEAFLDIGCGSGILSIAAVKLGCRRVAAIDHDHQAIVATRGNSRRNGVLDQIQLRQVDLAEFDPEPSFDIVVANMLLLPLVEYAPTIVRALRPTPQARLILAGVTEDQFPDVAAVYEPLGFREMRRLVEEGWVTTAWGLC
jgi:ribosomal protein L11 methyltransferase